MSDTGSRVRRSQQAGDGDYWPSDGSGGGGGGRGRRGRGGGGGGNRKLFIGGAVGLVLVVLAVIGVVAFSGGGSKSESPVAAVGGTTQAPPTVFDPQPASDGTKKLNIRKNADNRPLNKGEIFTTQAKKVTGDNFTFNQVATDLTTDCASVTWGAQLQADLKKYGCNQISRIAYLSSDNRHSGQAIAINLDSLEGAEAVLRDMAPITGGGGFVKPLAGAGIKNFGGGFSAAYPSPFGHYVLIPWVQRNGGDKPGSMNELIAASLAVEHGNDFAWQRLIDARG